MLLDAGESDLRLLILDMALRSDVLDLSKHADMPLLTDEVPGL